MPQKAIPTREDQNRSVASMESEKITKETTCENENEDKNLSDR